MKLDRIVVGTDLSEASERAAHRALAIARPAGAEVLLAHICDVVELDPDNPDLRQWGESRFRDRRAALSALTDRLSGQGVTVSQAVHDGHPAAALCDLADEVDAGLIVVGSHGGGGAIERFLLGSVSERVLRLANRTVLIARAGAGSFRKVLVPVDFSEITERVVETALALADDGAAVELFHCWHLPAGFIDDHAGRQAALINDLRDARASSSSDQLEQLLLAHRKPGVDLYFEHAESSAPRDGVLDRLESGDYDLVVLGSHGRRGLRRWLAGSVAEGVARAARCSVAVVKPRTRT